MEVKNKIMNCLNFTNNLAGVLITLKRKKKRHDDHEKHYE